MMIARSVGFEEGVNFVECRGRFDGGVDVVRRVVVFANPSMRYGKVVHSLPMNAC